MKEKNLLAGTTVWEEFISWQQHSSSYFSTRQELQVAWESQPGKSHGAWWAALYGVAKESDTPEVLTLATLSPPYLELGGLRRLHEGCYVSAGT